MPTVLAAARDVFAEHGFAAATVDAVAVAAGVSRVTLHRHGLSKQRLLELLAEEATAQYRDAMWPALTAGGTGAQRLSRALGALCDSAERNLPVLVALQGATDQVFHEDAEGEALTRTVFTEPLERLLRDGASDGSLRPTDPAETATVLFNVVGWSYVHLRAGHQWAPERARAALLQLVSHGLLRSGSS